MTDVSRRASVSASTLLPAASDSLLSVAATAETSTAGDPLLSQNDAATKKSITDFMSRVTKSDGPHYVIPEERVAA
jgi:hypothetical protein